MITKIYNIIIYWFILFSCDELVFNVQLLSGILVTHGIPSLVELLSTIIYRFADRVSKNPNSIIMACVTPIVYITLPFDNGEEQYYINLQYFILFCDILLLLLVVVVLYTYICYTCFKSFLCICAVCLH